MMLRKVKSLVTPRTIRWFAIGAAFTLLGVGLIKLMTGIWGWPYLVSTLVQSECCSVLRFLMVDRWVFGHARPTWRRLWQYHVANALGFAVWWGATNGLKAAGVNYLLAPIVGSAFSVGVNLAANFLWIWRKPRANPA